MRHFLTAVTTALLFIGSAHARTHHYHRHSSPAAVPAFVTKSYLVASADGQIIKEQDGDLVRPIASISKLMVALLSVQQDMDEELQIPSKRSVQSTIPPKVQTMKRKELLTLALVHSDNFAAQILCTNIPNCVDEMNQKATELGMLHTHYNEPTGLDKGNVSTAQDLLKLMLVAVTNPIISELSRMPAAEVPAGNRIIRVKNTNPLTAKLNVLLSKTGFTNPAGGCLLMVVQTELGEKFYILLGSKNTHTRVMDMENLVNG
jgi:D-alanyl-D-alanine endopeptidase (penicillin-binding protein 7)